jgi:hypothetical protein
MTTKDKLNKISGILTLGMLAMIVLGYFTENESLFGFPNAVLLYALMPLALIWFGTRKNGCGSGNQTSAISETKNEK